MSSSIVRWGGWAGVVALVIWVLLDILILLAAPQTVSFNSFSDYLLRLSSSAISRRPSLGVAKGSCWGYSGESWAMRFYREVERQRSNPCMCRLNQQTPTMKERRHESNRPGHLRLPRGPGTQGHRQARDRRRGGAGTRSRGWRGSGRLARHDGSAVPDTLSYHRFLPTLLHICTRCFIRRSGSITPRLAA